MLVQNMNGYIDHEYKGHKVRLFGEVVKINESDMSVKMKFENGVVSDGIPMEVVHVDEASIADIKNAAKKAWSYLKGKFEVVGGMIKKLWNGIAIPFNRASNIGAVAAQGGLPDGVGFYPSSEAIAEAETAGQKCSSQEAPDREGADSNGWNEDEAYKKFWRNIFNGIIKFKNESNTQVTGKIVKDFYLKEVKSQYGDAAFESLKNNPWLNDFFGLDNEVNEMEKYIEEGAVNSLLEMRDAGEPGLDSFRSENIREVGMGEIVSRIMTQLKAAFQAGEFNFDSEAGKKLKRNMMIDWFETEVNRLVSQGMEEEAAGEQAYDYAKELFKQFQKSSTGAKPVMVWGAPGIGKTSIIQQCRQMFKTATKGEGTDGQTGGFNINMLEVVLSKMTADDFTLPTKGEDEITGESKVVNAVQSWIPCWQVSGDKELDFSRNRAANLKMNSKSVLQKHGIDIKGDIENWRENAPNRVNLYKGDEDDTELSGLVTKNDPKNREDGAGEHIQNAEEFNSEIEGAMKKRRGRPRKITESVIDLFDKNEEKDNNKKNEDSVLTDGGIIFFDELTRAPKGVMNVIMNLINDRKVGEGWVLGSHWIIVCAANRFYEMTQVENTWEKAFGTRFIQMTFVPKWEDWKSWAMGYKFDPVSGRYSTSEKGPNKIDQEIIDFLETAKQAGIDSWYEKTNDSGDADRGAKLYANPRSWQTASDLMVAKAQELNPGKPYIRDPKTGRETVNLSREEKLACIADAVGIGSETYGQFRTWTNTRYYTDEMIDNIINFGTITGEKTSEVSDVEKKGKAKVSKSIMDDYIPVKEDDKGRKVRVNVDETTLAKLSDQIFDTIDWTSITNIQVANLLTYFAIITKVYQPGNTLFFDRQWKKIFNYLTRTYLTKKDMLPKDLQEMLGQALQTDGKGKKDKYMKWMEPCHKVFIFVNGWDGMPDDEINDMYTEKLEKEDVRSDNEAD